MVPEELLSVLKEINEEREEPLEESVLEEVLALVIKNPLDQDRARCQEQVKTVLSQKIE